MITPNNILGNLTATILDHLPQSLIALGISSNPPSTNLNIFGRDWFKFDKENLIVDYLSVDLENLIKSNNGNVDQSFVSFLTKFSSILDLYAPLKIFPNKNEHLRDKPWITLALPKPLSIKNHLLTKYIKLNDVTLQNEAQIKCKLYRNLLSTPAKESKRSYFTNYF